MSDNKYKHFGHAKTRLLYHIIFSTKYRRKCLILLKNPLLEIFGDIAKKYKISIKEIAIEPEHIHIMLSFKPRYSIEQVVRLLKQQSLFKIYASHEQILKKFYWGNKKKLWTNGYFCSTIGDVSEKTLKNYINNQG